MAGVSTPALAAAIANAGGLGSIALGACSLERARDEWDRARALTDGPLNLNVFAHAPPARDAERERQWMARLEPLFRELGAEPSVPLSSPYPTILEDDARFELLLSLRPRAISFHFGLPRPDQLDALHRENIVSMASVTNVNEARALEEAGVQICIAQGSDAGGHRSVFDPDALDKELRLSALLPRLHDAIKIPIIAAGGIMSGSRIRELLALGAAGVQLGTALLLTPEAATPPHYRARLKSRDANETRLLRSISGRPARGMPNRITALVEGSRADEIPPYPIAYDATKLLQAAASARGALGFTAEWAGEGAPALSEMHELPAQKLFGRLVIEAGLVPKPTT